MSAALFQHTPEDRIALFSAPEGIKKAAG